MSNVLTELSAALATAVSQADSGIVRVEGRRRLGATGIVWSAEGLILTANHVVRQDEGLTVGLPDGSRVAASLVGRDPSTDLAVLKAEASGLTPLTEGNKQELGVGNLVLALGRPGRTVQATLGIVSALGEGWRTRLGGQIDRYLQTDVVMYPGFSGGPLVDAAGQLIGLNTSALGRGVSLTIPTPTLARVADALQAHGRVQRGYLGVSTQRVHLPDELKAELEQKRGLLVVSVEKDSPAAKAGLTMGDTLVSFADNAVQSHDDLLALLAGDVVGTAVSAKFVRGGQVHTTEITVAARS
ncbi:MAG: trypsin-like peptidase domain-containing protein [Ardenticatenaceae bacterium]|nr:trypsin-like peptidase domain-containing protein [Ardenticatenaceae bacterium]MCB8948803.1 trypsin-like peptidase domain-containing protein [Ardenticatenaceae bacterium]